MTREELKNWLRSYRQKKLEAEQIAKVIDRLEAEMYHPKTTRFDKIPGSVSGAGSPTERLAVKHIDLVERYEVKRLALLEEQARIEDTIARLDDETERMLMRYRYLEGMTWEEVAVAICYSWKQMHRIHAKALARLCDD
jgi:RNA polymerase sigma factor (sigma-70 family)